MTVTSLLRLRLIALHGFQEIEFRAAHLVCAGWVGRDRNALQAHIDELASLGVPAPKRVPIFMSFSPSLLTTESEVQVIGSRSSGEVEYVLLCRGDEMWVTVGSDHTDREIEKTSIPASKQMYSKFVASECWRYPEVQDHWDSLVLRSWVTKANKRALYQEASLGTILPPEELLSKMPERPDSEAGGWVLFSGTIPTIGGVTCGESYELLLEDPVLNRSIQARYTVRQLPQHL